MTLICKPKGKGNWSPITMAIEGKRAGPLLFRVGSTFFLGGGTFRICRVLP